MKMKREEIYEKVMEISNKYNLPVSINKKTKKKELQKIYDNVSKLTITDNKTDNETDNKTDNEIIDDDNRRVVLPVGDDDVSSNDSNKDVAEPLDDTVEEYKGSPKQPTKRKVKSNRMIKILKTQSINSLKREINLILNKYNKEIDEMISEIKKLKDLTDEDVDTVIDNYNDARQDTENEINLSIDTYKGSIPDSFYTYVETQLDRKKNKLERLIS